MQAKMLNLPEAELDRISEYFAPPNYENLPAQSESFEAAKGSNSEFNHWVKTNLVPHKTPGYGIVNISLKPIGGIPGDATDVQMDVIADLAERYALDEVRVTHEQNLVLPHVKLDDLKDVYDILCAHNLPHRISVSFLTASLARSRLLQPCQCEINSLGSRNF